MDFLDKLSKTATKTYKYTTKKTNDFAYRTKLKLSMHESKDRIEEIYEKIGKRIYEAYINDEKYENIETRINELCIEIDVLCDKIEDERKELLMLRNIKQCPNCYSEIEIEYCYCPICGSSQEEIYNNEEDLENMDMQKSENTKEQNDLKTELSNSFIEDNKINLTDNNSVKE